MSNTLDRKVLALNRAWIPIDVVSYRDAFRLSAKGHAKILETVNNSYIMHDIASWIDLHSEEHNYKSSVNTVSYEIPVPEIIVMTEYDHIPARFITFNKQNLLIRDDYKCAYCGCDLDLSTTTIDHIIPQARGGETSWKNCVSSCKQCNNKKDCNMPVGEFTPRTEPREPFHGNPIFGIRNKFHVSEMPRSWKQFLHIKDENEA